MNTWFHILILIICHFAAAFHPLLSIRLMHKVANPNVQFMTRNSINPNIIYFESLSGDDEPDHEVSTIKLPDEKNVTASLLSLVSIGDTYFHSSRDDESSLSHSSHHFYKSSQLTKVRGCIADVSIKVAISNNHASAARLYITGKADSRIAQGLLALICKNLSGMTTNEVLSLSAQFLTNKWGLDSLNLPQGRMNGFANMLSTVQDLVRKMTDSEYDDGTEVNTLNIEKLNEPSVYHSDEIAMLLSGGVDSSVALKLLLLQGYKVRAFYLKIWLEDELSHLNECPWEEDLEYATSVCEQLNVPLETLSLQKEYWAEVVQYTLSEAKLGRTPNPDIMCNSRIKFGMFYKYVGQYYAKIATGHYAQVRRREPSDSNEFELFCSPDPVKDQTYFLCNLSQEQLSKALFPIGHLKKTDVRVLAEEFNLPTRHRKDSQGICFLGKLKFEDFMEHYLGKKEGPMKDYTTGAVVGKHQGLWFHTVGQRKGLGPLMNHGTLHLGPWFVADKDPISNTLFVTNNLQVIDKPRTEFSLNQINWISGQAPLELIQPPFSMQLMLKLRHGPTFTKGTVLLNNNYRDNMSIQSWNVETTLDVKLVEKDKGIACGQFAALYADGICLGAGIISSTVRD